MGSQRVWHLAQSTYLLQVVQGVNSPSTAAKEILLASISASLVFAGTLSRAGAAELLRWGVPARFMPLMLGTGRSRGGEVSTLDSTLVGWNAESPHLWEDLWPLTRDEILTFYTCSYDFAVGIYLTGIQQLAKIQQRFSTATRAILDRDSSEMISD